MEAMARRILEVCLTSAEEAVAAALAGADMIRRLIERAGERIEILPAGGVSPANAAEVVARTGCTQLHGSFRRNAGPDEAMDPNIVAAMRSLLDGLQT